MSMYLSKRDCIQTGDVIQWQSKSTLGWLIRKRTGAEANHTAIAIRLNPFDTERVFVLEALGHGTVLNPLSARIKSHNGRAWVLPLKTVHGPLRRYMGAWALNHVGIGYDYQGIIKQLWRRVTPNEKRLFCSEYWWMAFKSAAHETEDGRKALLEARKVLMGKAPQPGDIKDLGLTGEAIQIL